VSLIIDYSLCKGILQLVSEQVRLTSVEFNTIALKTLAKTIETWYNPIKFKTGGLKGESRKN